MWLKKKIKDEPKMVLANNEFKIYLQPKFDIIKNKIVGAEALIRWQKEKKIILPDKFISAFEKNGFISKIDFFVLEQVCLKIKDWLKKNMNAFKISVNISGVTLSNKKFISSLKKISEKYKNCIRYLELEITEMALSNFKNADLFLDVINKIKEFGFGLAMDDFGSGYSNLNLLCDMNIDVLKLDKGFLSNKKNIMRAQIVIKYIILMAKKLGLSVVVEGVETREQIDFLKSVGCEIVQGFYFSEALSINEFENKFMNINKIEGDGLY